MKIKKIFLLSILFIMLPIFTFAENFKGIKIYVEIDKME